MRDIPQMYWGEDWTDDEGNLVRVHKRDDTCFDYGCAIHFPSDHHMRNWPRLWRQDKGIVERLCEHGVGHPDPDAVNYQRMLSDDDPEADALGVHGCDGCCDPEGRRAVRAART